MYRSRNICNSRIEVADALRGVAVMGIILLHAIDHFDVFTAEPITYSLPCDTFVEKAATWLLRDKMYGLFALLFGLSFFIMNDDQQQKGRAFAGRYAWRMLLLFLLGTVNLLFYDGDILMHYAVYGLLLIPASFLPSWAVWCIIGLLAIQPVELFCLVTGHSIDHTWLLKVYNNILAVHENGTFLENAAMNLRYGFALNLLYYIYSGRLTQMLCLFLLGMQLGRHRLFYDEGKNLRHWHLILGVTAAATVAMSLFDFGALKTWLSPIYHLTIAAALVSAIVSLWYASKVARQILRHLCPFGRMSLTNYLLSSIVGCFLFYGYGLGCYKTLGTTYAMLIGLAMIAAQYLFSRYWLRHHSRGPLESLWRKLTWMGG